MALVTWNWCCGDELEGHWEGAIILQGVAWPVELDFEKTESVMAAALSIRSMGMIGNPIEISSNERGEFSVQLPYGIGDMQLLPADGLIVAHRKIQSGRRISVILEKIEDYQLPYHEEEVTFSTGNLVLKGTILVPNDHDTLHAGVVILHGSQVNGRDSWEYRSWADYYARLGLVALVYDKRPYDDIYPDLHDLASDAKAALEYLQERPETRSNAVGFSGGSEAGWLAAEVASEPGETPGFVIVSGWPAVTPREQESLSIANKLRDSDLTTGEVEEALAYLDLYFYHAQSGQLWEELKSAAEDASTRAWTNYVPIPETQSEMLWWSRNHRFPAESYLQQLQCPVLACYGQNDRVVPPSRNAERLREFLDQSGNQDVSIRVFEDGDHRIELPFIISSEQVRWPQLSPDYLLALESWCRSHNLAN